MIDNLLGKRWLFFLVKKIKSRCIDHFRILKKDLDAKKIKKFNDVIILFVG
jgi:hypothetical protein